MQLYRLMGILILLLREGRLTAPRLAERFEVSPGPSAGTSRPFARRGCRW